MGPNQQFRTSHDAADKGAEIERSYRFLYTDTGFLGQNLCLVSETLCLGACLVPDNSAAFTPFLIALSPATPSHAAEVRPRSAAAQRSAHLPRLCGMP